MKVTARCGKGRTVLDFQGRRAAPCRNVSESTDLLDRTALRLPVLCLGKQLDGSGSVIGEIGLVLFALGGNLTE